MSETKLKYRSLPGRSRLINSRLYLADDHLLIVQRSWFSEDHWRFDLKDLHAFVIHPNKSRLAWTIVWGTMLAILILVHLSTVGFPGPRAPGETWVFVAFELPLAMAFIVNLTLGPTCHLSIRTAVQQKRIPCISRLLGAQRMMEDLAPAIAVVQGALSDDELRQRVAVLQQPPPFPAVPTDSAADAVPVSLGPTPVRFVSPAPVQPSNNYRGGAHLWMSFALLACGVSCLLAATGVLKGINALAMLLMLAGLILAIVALVKQSGSSLPHGKTSPILAILFTIGMYIVIGIIEAVVTGMDAGILDTQPMSLRGATGYVSGILTLLIGLYALMQCLAWQAMRKVRAPEPVAQTAEPGQPS